MLSKAQQKKITSLKLKKNRYKEGLFIVEGVKLIEECINSHFALDCLYSTGDYFNHEFININENDLSKISQLKTPQKALALFKIPVQLKTNENGLILLLDAVRDPGNFGTIIRMADWFGVRQIICSKDTVDCYNPKVVQATMGSLARVQIHYLELESYIKKTSLPAYATSLTGKSIYRSDLPKDALLIMGNEAKGVSKEIMDLVENELYIPRFSEESNIESLNVATATAICLNEFRKPLLKSKI